MTRASPSAKQVGERLILGTERYEQRPDRGRLVCHSTEWLANECFEPTLSGGWTARSAVLLRRFLGPIRLEPVPVEVGRRYYRPVTAIDTLALIETPPELNGPDGGSTSLRSWALRDSNPRPLPCKGGSDSLVTALGRGSECHRSAAAYRGLRSSCYAAVMRRTLPHRRSMGRRARLVTSPNYGPPAAQRSTTGQAGGAGPGGCRPLKR